ncbi:TspO/MBR family protein [Intestinibacter sp.]|uniref:TspO/MBR family protein n=1 Tax=Intestinibacter sp. TaxID=1965304 RepID=UPI002FE6E0D4
MKYLIISVKEIKKFIICVLIPILIGYLSFLISTLISQTSFEIQYLQLIKPDFAPSSDVFQIVWPILYVLMGISYYIVIKSQKSTQKIKEASFFYYLQLALNFLWSVLFFGFNLRFVALVEIFILMLILMAMIYTFFNVNVKAALLNVPYLIWITYAMVLNYFIWILNK